MPSITSRVCVAVVSGAAAVAGFWLFVAVPWLRKQDASCVVPSSSCTDVKTKKKIRDACEEIIRNRNFCSLLKKYLSRQMVKKLENRKTFLGATLWDIIRAGYLCPNTEIGIYAADAESYITFRDLFYPIIREIHCLECRVYELPSFVHGSDFSIPPEPEFQFPNGKILETTLTCRRNLQGFPMLSLLSRAELCMVEERIKHVTYKFHFDNELSGEYVSFSEQCSLHSEQLSQEVLTFSNSDSQSLKVSGGYENWPLGRGMYWNSRRTLGVWVNAEDHLCIISRDQNSGLFGTWQLMKRALNILSSELLFSRDAKLGFLTMSPANVGCALKVKFRIALPHSQTLDQTVAENCQKLHLNVIRINEDCMEVENLRCLGLREEEVLTEAYHGVMNLIDNFR